MYGNAVTSCEWYQFNPNSFLYILHMVKALRALFCRVPVFVSPRVHRVPVSASGGTSKQSDGLHLSVARGTRAMR